MQENAPSNQGKYRELTTASIVGGVLVGIVLNMGIVFAGMQIGFTIVGSTVGAILGFGLLRGIMRRGSILEVNIFQTIASSVNTVNAGVIFTVPVLFLLGMQDDIDYTSMLLATMAGSILGIVMIVPLRKQIIDYERLRFPTAVGVAAILKSPGAGVEKAQLLVFGIVLAGAVKALTMNWGGDGHGTILPEEFNVGMHLGIPRGIHLVFAVSFLTLGAGYIAGKAGLVVLYGTLLNFWFLVPVGAALGWVGLEYLPGGEHSEFDLWASSTVLRDGTIASTEAHYEAAGAFIGSFVKFTSRNVGIGLILGGAIAGILVAAPALRAALGSLRSSGTGRREEASLGALNAGFGLGILLMFFAAKLSGGEDLSWGTAGLLTLVGGLWLWIAGLVVAQTTGRTDWSPLSGLALIAIALMMWILGTDDSAIIPAVTMGAAICVATSMCADMMADFKTGYLVGGMPLKQQVAQMATGWIGPGISLLTVILLWQAYGFGPDQAEVLYDRAVAAGPEALAAFEAAEGSRTSLPEGTPTLGAPQAGALQAAINVVQDDEVAVGKYLTGAGVGLLVSMLTNPGMGVMVGLSLYLPFSYMIVFGIGGILSMLVIRFKGARFAEDKGVPIAAGLIVGDALVGVANAVLKVGASIGGAL